MPTYSVSKTWNASETLTAADLNGIESQVATFLNTTKLDGDNIKATATYTFGGIVLGSGGPAAPDGGNLHSFNGDASASAHADADEGVFENSAAVGISLLGGATSSGNIFVGDSGDNDIGKLSYSNATNAWTIYSNATLALTLSSAQLATFAGAIQADSTLTVGLNDTGHDVKFFGATAGAHFLWDESADDLKLVGAAGLTVAGTAALNATTTTTVTAIGAVTVGVNDTGHDVKFFGATAGKSWLWDESADTEILTGNSTISGTLGVTGVLTATAQSVHTGGLVSGSNIVSDTDSTDDLGTTGVRWANLYVDAIVATDTIAATSYTGALLTAVTAVTQSAGNNSTKVSTTAYADAAFSVGATHTWTADQTFNDSVKVTLGTGGDADLYYDATNVVLNPKVVGSGVFNVLGSGGYGAARKYGTLHVQTSSVTGGGADVDADDLIVELTGASGGITVITDDNQYGSLYFGSATANAASGIRGSYNSGSQYLKFLTAGSTQMTIDSSGKVGIGTAAPFGRLNVHGAYTAPATGIGLSSIFASSSDSLAANKGGVLQFGGVYNSGGDVTQWATIQGLKENATDGNVLGYLSFVTRGSSIAERMRISSLGVLTATSSGATSAHNLVQTHATNPNGLYIHFSGAAPDNNTRYAIRFEDTAAIRLYVYSDGDVANHDGTYGTISDVKFKQDITDARVYWDDFKLLQYRKFRHKTDVEADPDAPYRLGLIAQEVETVFPALVPESPDGDITETINVIETVLDDGGDPVLDADGNETTRVVMIPVVDEGGEPILDADGNETLEAKTEEVTTPSGTTHKWVKSSIIEGPIMASVVQELMARVEALEAA